MKRCEKCTGFKGEPTPVKVGDMVDFVIRKSNGKSVKLSSLTGKLMLIKNDGFSVVYRGTVYHADEVSNSADPSPLTIAFVGYCTC